MLLLLNKQDLPEHMSREEMFSQLDLQTLFLANFRIVVQECSAKTKYGLWEGVAQLAGFLESSEGAISSGREKEKEKEKDGGLVGPSEKRGGGDSTAAESSSGGPGAKT